MFYSWTDAIMDPSGLYLAAWELERKSKDKVMSLETL